jgi:hypothetical protein
MWDDLLALVVGAVFVPTVIVLGLFRFTALKRVTDLRSRPVEEWTASQELHRPT